MILKMMKASLNQHQECANYGTVKTFMDSPVVYMYPCTNTAVSTRVINDICLV